MDGEAYFRAIYESFQKARRSIFIVGWDLHSRLALIRDDEKHGYPVTLGALINRITSENKALHVYILFWDFSMIYTMEREFFPRYKFKWKSNSRVHFTIDGHHPTGASQHQKIVVIDDSLAFAGGMDLSKWRWDTSRHLPDDPRRTDPDGEQYPPFHDIQMAVSGQAAHRLGEVSRERWTKAGGEKPVDRHFQEKIDPWPESIRPDLKNVPVIIARTLPQYMDQEAVQEIEQLYLDSIAAAERYIYIENQYLSSHRIGKALGSRLKEADGPEVVIVMPKKTGGWLEQHTMDILRGRLLKELRKMDIHGRLRTYYPRLRVDPHLALMVHAKVMIIDGDFLRIGSSNLSNRSMGFDSELDLAIFAEKKDDIQGSITDFRNRLLAEHLDRDVDKIADVLAGKKSFIDGIESLRGNQRTLVPFAGEVPEDVDMWVPESELLDPERPIEPDELLDYFVSKDQQPSAYRLLWRILLLVSAVLFLAGLWRWSPLGDFIDLNLIVAAGEWLRHQTFAPVLVYTGFILAGVTAFPITLMFIASIIVFGPFAGGAYALSGALLSGMVVFAAGRVLGRETVRKLSGSFFNKVNRKLAASGIHSVITVRMIPVAPFSLINLIAGASEIRFRDFVLGTIIGMVPGVIAIGLITEGILFNLNRSGIAGFGVLFALIALVAAGLVGMKTWLTRKHKKHASKKND